MIDKGIPAPGLLAQVVIAKHDDHLPLYRQTEICARSGVHIARSSMAQWIGICGVRLAPLVDALKDFIRSHSVVHADETLVALLAPGLLLLKAQPAYQSDFSGRSSPRGSLQGWVRFTSAPTCGRSGARRGRASAPPIEPAWPSPPFGRARRARAVPHGGR